MEQIQKETEALEARERELKRTEQSFEDEKEKMSMLKGHKATGSDILEINVGGEVMLTKRSTLTLPEGTVLEAMFSGRWDESLDRDASGRAFLDFTPEVFRILLSHLRAVRNKKPEQHMKAPVVPEGLITEFQTMVQFLELDDFLYGKCSCTPLALKTQMAPGFAGITCSGGAILAGRTGHSAVIGEATLLEAGTARAAWKVSVINLPSKCWMYMGIIGHCNPTEGSYEDSSSHGWASGEQVYVAGQHKSFGGWSTWEQGDVAVFQLDADASRLCMFHHRLATTFTQNLPNAAAARQARLHFILHAAGTSLEVCHATTDDTKVFG